MLIKDNRPYAYKNNRYRSQLKILLEECPTLDVSGLDYTDKSLIKLLTAYHSYCKIDYGILFKNKSKVKVNIGIAGGGYFYPKDAPDTPFDASVRFLLPKKFYNRFLSIEWSFLKCRIILRKRHKQTVSLRLHRIFRAYPSGGWGGVSFRKKLDFSIVAIRATTTIGFRVKFYPTIRSRD